MILISILMTLVAKLIPNYIYSFVLRFIHNIFRYENEYTFSNC